MGKTLTEIAQELKNDKTVQLVYAFNGQGKTRLSKEFKSVVEGPQNDDESDLGIKIIYYNAFTEDLFRWDNDLDNNVDIKLQIVPNRFTELIFKDQGQDRNVITYFQQYTSRALNPKFSEDFSEVTFSFQRGDNQGINNVKISKGEESNFIWCIFYTLLKTAVDTLKEGDESTRLFNNLEYVFIDDPVSSLDDNHLIQLAVDVAELIKNSNSHLKFIITTHNPLFYNVLYNEINNFKKIKKEYYLLDQLEDKTFTLKKQGNDSPFAYHIFLLKKVEQAIEEDKLEKYHFNYLRNIFEKTATFLGYKNWRNLLPKKENNKPKYKNRLLNFRSHSKHSAEEFRKLTFQEKIEIKEIVEHLKEYCHFFWDS